MKLVILSLVRDDLKAIRLYLSEYGESPPKRFREGFQAFCAQIMDMPFSFSPYEHAPSYFKGVIAYDYLVFYKVDIEKGRVMIYRVLHSKRDARPLLG
ncbi:MAG: type II toxin-antitoxin system RelE/ParE family toxin [Defluviitaleaceae bacterium]|nr:type II toxin-antitoxin system RelE/ParE family toxin [Defluviitaleaceae bacterium]